MNKNNYINLRRELRGLAARNRDGSFSTQHTRRKILDLCARQLQERGYYQLSARGLKPKHIHALINRWQTENLSVGTLKNRIAAIRWWTEKINKVSMMPKDNRAYGIQSRVFVTHRSKALSLTAKDWSKIADPRLLLSLKLQQAFGLRREECLKFQPRYADKGNYIRLKDTWTKGGKARRIPIVSHAQRVLLNQVHQVAGKGSLIPPEKSYVQQMHYYDRITHQAGLNKLHGSQSECAYGIQSRVFVTHHSKALSLTAKDWSKIADPRLLLSLKLQQAFGLRREECLKFQPRYADKGNYIRLKDTWTKGGKARRIPIVSHAQRVLLNQVHQVAGKGSLIPPEKSYVQQMHYYYRITHQAGLNKLHGLRHAYTQARYEAITGFKCPVQGGKNKRHMTPSERQKDERARLIISRELGHEREEITAIYLGR